MKNQVSVFHDKLLGRRLTLVELIGRPSPKVANLLGLDITGSKRRTLQWWSRNLQDRQRGSVRGERFSHTRNAWDEWRE